MNGEKVIILKEAVVGYFKYYPEIFLVRHENYKRSWTEELLGRLDSIRIPPKYEALHHSFR
jgi:hypothetical protein